MIARRRFLSAAALGAGALFVAPGLALATVPTEQSFVFIIQRGAADGFDILRPTGDPAFAALRSGLIGDAAAGTKLDAMFTLHPSLVEVGRMYGQGQALFVHAVASPYRDRSHFDGQNVLETGGASPTRCATVGSTASSRCCRARATRRLRLRRRCPPRCAGLSRSRRSRPRPCRMRPTI